MNYITLADIQTYLDVTLTTNGTNLFNLLQTPLQDAVDRYCNRSWNIVSPITENFDAYDSITNPPKLNDTFFPKYHIDPNPYNASYPQAQGIRSITTGVVNGQGGTQLDLTSVFSYGSSIKFFNWFAIAPLFNPFGYKSVQIVYNSDDAGTVPG